MIFNLYILMLNSIRNNNSNILYMKNKIGNHKQTPILLKTGEFSSLNASTVRIGKNTSKHTKSPTDHTISSFHVGISNKKNQKVKKSILTSKNKKINLNKEKQQSTSCHIKKPKSKCKQKKSLDFQLENHKKIQNEDAISYREYCLVDDSFIPITSNFEHKKIDQKMKSTADSTPFFEDYTRTKQRKVFPFKLKQSMKTTFQQSTVGPENNNSNQICQKQIFSKPSPIYQQIGIQYSERYPTQEPIQIQKTIKKVVEIGIQTNQIKQNEQISDSKVELQSDKSLQNKKQADEPLQILFLKLEFNHLSNEKSFQSLSKIQKNHYSCLLNEIIRKLAVSPRDPPNNTFKTRQKIQIEEVQFYPLEQITIKYEKLQIQIYRRQCYQTNIMQRPFNPEDPQQSVDTSLLAINTFLFNFFCYVELNYPQEFLKMIKKEFGISYRQEYQRLTRKISLPTKTLKVLDECLFQDFCDQTLNQVSIYEKVHLKAAFDCINDLLDTYRPFYNHHGEPFPWSFKMYHNICEYAFDEDSLQIIFGQIKETLENDASNLCGIILDEKYFSGVHEKKILEAKRYEKQNIFIKNWLNENNHETKAIECQATKTLFNVSELIYNQLLLEILQEKPLFNEYEGFQFIE